MCRVAKTIIITEITTLLLQAKENKNITMIRTLAQLMCHCFPDIKRLILSFEIVGHAHGALDRGECSCVQVWMQV